jgi:hypothetical protein
VHPFARKEPKPTRARLVTLLDPLGRKRYAEVERFLATIGGATSGLHYYDDDWGWAVRYMIGAKDVLCTLHLLPKLFESTVAVNAGLDRTMSAEELGPELRRRIARTKPVNGVRWVRMPIRSDGDYRGFQALIRFKAEAIRTKTKGQKPQAAVAAVG